MYVVIKTGGKQYNIEKGDIIDVEYLKHEPGEKVELSVNFAMDDNDKIINPKKVKVTAEVVENFKDKKVTVFKFKRRKNYHRTKGHRQKMSRVKIEKIELK